MSVEIDETYTGGTPSRAIGEFQKPYSLHVVCKMLKAGSTSITKTPMDVHSAKRQMGMKNVVKIIKNKTLGGPVGTTGGK